MTAYEKRAVGERLDRARQDMAVVRELIGTQLLSEAETQVMGLLTRASMVVRLSAKIIEREVKAT